MAKIKIGGVMQSDGRALVRVMAVPSGGGAAASMMQSLGRAGINIELLVQSIDLDEYANFAMVIAQKDLDHALSVLEEIKSDIDAKALSYNPDVATISVFGPHLREKPMVPGEMLSSIASVGIPVLSIATSISSVSAVVEGQHMDPAIEALLEVFDVPFHVRKRPKEY